MPDTAPAPRVERAAYIIAQARQEAPDPAAPWWARALHRFLVRRIAQRREPCKIIGGRDDPYLIRWRVFPHWFPVNLYLHRFVRSDDDRALHDHPFASVSVILGGGYLEHLPGGVVVERRPGDVTARGGRAAHRVELHPVPGLARYVRRGGEIMLVPFERPVWTLFLIGPRYREWGFVCPQGWVHWRDFTSGPQGETVGKGCD